MPIDDVLQIHPVIKQKLDDICKSYQNKKDRSRISSANRRKPADAAEEESESKSESSSDDDEEEEEEEETHDELHEMIKTMKKPSDNPLDEDLKNLIESIKKNRV
jgi:hypothetical protein